MYERNVVRELGKIHSCFSLAQVFYAWGEVDDKYMAPSGAGRGWEKFVYRAP
jgi:hypothetical protein